MLTVFSDEVHILEGYENETYADGLTAAVYGAPGGLGVAGGEGPPQLSLSCSPAYIRRGSRLSGVSA